MKIKNVVYIVVITLSITMNIASVIGLRRINLYTSNLEKKEKAENVYITHLESKNRFLFEMLSLKISSFNSSELSEVLKKSGVEYDLGIDGKKRVNVVFVGGYAFEYPFDSPKEDQLLRFYE